MENNEDKAKAPSEPKISATPPPPRAAPPAGKTSTKVIAVIVGLVIVIAVLGALLAINYHPAASSSGPSATLSASTGAVTQGQIYTTTINATGSFNNMTVYFGDGASHLYKYNNNKSVQVSHNYTQPGEYYIYADINYGSSHGYYLQPVKVNPDYNNPGSAYSTLSVNPTESSSQFINNISNIFSTNGHMRLDFNPASGGGVNQIISQQLTLSNLSTMVSQQNVPYGYSTGAGAYVNPITGVTYAGLQNGMYVLEINTTTAPVNYTQPITTTVTNMTTVMFPVMLTGSSSTMQPVTAGETIMGSGSQNISYTVKAISNLTFGMGTNATFGSTGGALFSMSTAVNLTLHSGYGIFYNATQSHAINMTGGYSMVPAGYYVQFGNGASARFNSAGTGMSMNGTNMMNFTGMFSLGFGEANVVYTQYMNNAAPNAVFDAGTAFTSLSGQSATFATKTNVTVTNGTNATFNKVPVVMNTDSNVSVISGSVYNASGVLATKHGYLDLKAGENYTFGGASSAQLRFNPASTGIMVNDTGQTFAFQPGVYQLTLKNKTGISGFTTSSNNVRMWVPVDVQSMLNGASTVPLNNGQYNQSATVTSTYYEDFPVMSKVTQNKGVQTSFTNAEPNAPGGYTTLDPAIEYYTADVEILQNTLLTLDTYNGSSTSSYVPIIATSLPTQGNGINTNYVNKTVTTPWGTHYQYNTTPGENYTFHVNTNIVFQNGVHMSAWDVLYSLTRTLLFDAGSPGTGGWVIAQYLLPGDIYSSNTFYNITQNITVNNASNTITFHFQTPMPASLVFQILQSSGTQVEPASWFAAHNAKITWNAAGFQAYKKYGLLANYNTYIQNHILADGPYMLSYVIPGSQVTLVKNPSYVAPNPYFRVASINTVNILYLSSNEQAFLLLRSGQAQSAALPTTYFNQTKAMIQSGLLQQHAFPTLGIYFYTYTENINTGMLHSISSQANVPSGFFVNPNVRKAFSYAYNYSLYYAKQVGNQIYNTTFLSPYVGMLPPGMLYNQTAQDLINNHVNVINANGHENAQISMAKSYWNKFMATVDSKGTIMDGPAAMGITTSGGKVLYNGNPLNIPVMIPQNDPTDQAAVTTWAGELAQVIPGIVVTPVPLPLTQIFQSYAIPGANPMPISWGGWSPDYPYPTDYLVPMGMPQVTSTYMGPAGYTVNVIGNTSMPVYNMTEATFMKQELQALNNSVNNATNPTAAQMWFHKANGMIVNSTVELYIGQAVQRWTQAANLNGTDIINYQENVMIGGGQEIQYFLMSYNSTS